MATYTSRRNVGDPFTARGRPRRHCNRPAAFRSSSLAVSTAFGRELAPLQAGRGGPIIAVQVENEYGSFDNDHEYMREIRDAIVHAGFTDALLYTADGPGQLEAGTLPDLPAVVNFGPGEAAKAFEALARFRPGAPRMAGEYWAGWFDQWGHKHNTTDRALDVRELAQMLAAGDSVNLYMFHGGPTFGFMNGANVGNEASPYEPQTTSYDYDAALDESGRPMPKYFAFREIIAKHLGTPFRARSGRRAPGTPLARYSALHLDVRQRSHRNRTSTVITSRRPIHISRVSTILLSGCRVA
jgi:beta-galactosidase